MQDNDRRYDRHMRRLCAWQDRTCSMHSMNAFLLRVAVSVVIASTTGCFGTHATLPSEDGGATTDVRLVAVLDSSNARDANTTRTTDASSPVDARIDASGDARIDASGDARIDASAATLDSCVFPTRLPATCAGAVQLQVPDRRFPCVDAFALPPERGGCFSGSSLHQYVKVTVPARTGVELRVEGPSTPAIILTNACAPPPGSASCVYYTRGGSFSPGPTVRSEYFGNASDTPLEIVASLWWAPEWTRSPFSIETIAIPLPSNTSCEHPDPFPLDRIASATPGGYYSGCAGDLRHGRFYSLSVPPQSRVRFGDPQPRTYITRDCDCTHPADPFYNDRENLTDLSLPITLFMGDDAPIWFEPMPGYASCNSAPELTLGGTQELDMNFAGHADSVCGERPITTEGASYVRVNVPAGRRVQITATVARPGPEQSTLLWATTDCNVATCTGNVESGMGRERVQLMLVASADQAQMFFVGVGMLYLPGENQIVTLGATLL